MFGSLQKCRRHKRRRELSMDNTDARPNFAVLLAGEFLLHCISYVFRHTTALSLDDTIWYIFG